MLVTLIPKHRYRNPGKHINDRSCTDCAGVLVGVQVLPTPRGPPQPLHPMENMGSEWHGHQ